MFAAGIVDENTPHGFGGGGEKLGAILPLRLLVTTETQPRFVNQRGGLKRLPGIFPREFLAGQNAQFFVKQTQQLFGGHRNTNWYAPER